VPKELTKLPEAGGCRADILSLDVHSPPAAAAPRDVVAPLMDLATSLARRVGRLIALVQQARC
jgi:hypothetical protein